MESKRESFALMDWDTEKEIGWGIDLTADDGNGELVTSLQMANKNDSVEFIVGTAEYDLNDKVVKDDWQAISITESEAIGVRNWLVKQFPFTKQELVDLMGAVAK